MAGLWEDCPIRDLSLKSMDHVMRPKVLGAWTLHEVFRSDDLDFFVMFSSFSSFIPARGQASYAAGNTFLDVLAQHRRNQGQVAMTINWGPWSDIGFGATEFGEKAHQGLERMGIQRTTPKEGFAILQILMRTDVASSGVISLDWAKLSKAESAISHPFFEEVVVSDEADRATGKQGTAAKALVREINLGSSDQGMPKLLSRMQELVADVMNHDRDLLDPKENLNDIGLDSLMAVEIKNRVQSETGVDIPIIQVLDGLSVNDLTENVIKHLHISGLQLEESSIAETGVEIEEFNV